jgi:TonB family protein
LLAIIPISLVLPFFNLSESIIVENTFLAQLPEITINSNQENSGKLAINWESVFWTISLGLMLMYIFKLVQLAWLIFQLKKGANKNILPFSFFHFIYIPKDVDNDAKDMILAHEKIHAKEFHSLDILIFEIYKTIFWFNPLVWIALKNVKNNHEFIADNIVSQSNKKHYFNVLIAQLLGANCSDLVNNFNNQLLIKKRIAMMKTQKTNSIKALNYLLIIPIMVIALMGAATLNAQESNAKTVKKADKIYEQVDQMPEFKGGMDALMKYMGDNVTYPEKAKEEKIEGKVFVSFVVNEKGKVTQIKIEKGAGELLDKEALRVINKMPDWTPGKHEGKNVNVKMHLPINFKLDDK